jgi:hypothetical protein
MPLFSKGANMFFTKIGKILAHLMFWLGLLRVAMGFLFALGAPDMESNRAAARHFLSAATTGEAINEGMIAILVGVAFGILAEISARLSADSGQA